MAGVQKNMEFLSRERTQSKANKTSDRESMLSTPELKALAHAEQRIIAALEAVKSRVRTIMEEKRNAIGKGFPEDRRELDFELSQNRREYFRLSVLLGTVRQNLQSQYSATVIHRANESMIQHNIFGEMPDIPHSAQNFSECAYKKSKTMIFSEHGSMVDMKVF
jgi:hypothetical protein